MKKTLSSNSTFKVMMLSFFCILATMIFPPPTVATPTKQKAPFHSSVKNDANFEKTISANMIVTARQTLTGINLTPFALQKKETNQILSPAVLTKSIALTTTNLDQEISLNSNIQPTQPQMALNKDKKQPVPIYASAKKQNVNFKIIITNEIQV
jgi:hypothetical protein